MKRIKVWIEAMRLRTLPVSLAGVIAGCGCAAHYHTFRPLPALICLVFALLAQIASNFANEYFDFRAGLDRKGREGFRRGVTEGDISPRAMLCATVGVLAADALIGLSLICFGGWWLLIPGVLIAIFAMAYSAGPWPLSHHGLGDLAVVVFFGLVPVTLTCYVQGGAVAWSFTTVAISAAVGLAAANVLIVNNYRDADDDRAVGKHTTVVLLGRRVMSTVYLLGGLGAGALVAAALWGTVSSWWLVAEGAYAFGVVALWWQLTHSRGASLNPLLGKTAMTLLLFTILMTIAMTT